MTVVAASGGAGQGSPFELPLPLPIGVAPPPSPTTPQRVFRRAAIALRIVIVDDNPDMREMLHSLLSLYGHTVEGAPDGPQGLALILASRPDLAIVDIGLPGIDGYEVARQVRKSIAHATRLIALTGHRQPEDQKRAFDAGFDHHLTKPISLESLESALAERPTPSK